MFQIKQSEATAARRRIPVLFVSSTDGFTPVTPTTPLAYISTNGATWAATTNAVAVATLAAGQSAAGVYYLELTAAEVANLGWITVNIQATNARQYNAHIQVMAFDPYDVVRIGITGLPNVAQGNAGALPTGNASGQVTVATNNDKTGYSLTQAFPTNFATLAITAGGAVTAGTVNDKTGYSLSASQTFATTGAVGSVTGAVGSVTGAVGSVTGNVGGNLVGSVGSLTATAVQNVWDDATSSLTVVGSVGKLLVDNLNATVSSRSTLTDTQVWAAATRTLTAGTNIVLAKGTGITGFNDISTTQVWSEALPGTYTSGQAGFKLNAAGSAADPWSTALPGVYSAGSAGNIIGNMVANTWAAGTRTLTSGANIALAKGTGITGFNDITALSVWDILATTVGVAGSIGLQLKTNIDVATSTRMASFTLPTNFNALAITAGGAVTAGTVNDKTGYSLATAPLTAGQTASAVWDALLASYTVNNSFGQRVLRGSTAQAACAVTGSNHIAADIHQFQPGVITAGAFATDAITNTALAASAVTEIQTGLATSTAVSGVATVTTKLDSTLQASGAVYQFTTNALALAPAGGGGGGGTTTTVAMGPFEVRADGNYGAVPADIQTGSSHNVSLQCINADGTGVNLSGATLTVKVYANTGTLVATYSGTAIYASAGWLQFGITTAVTNTVGTYTLTVTRSTSATDTQVFGPLRVYVRSI